MKYIPVLLIFIIFIIVGNWALFPNNAPEWTGFGERKIIEGHEYSKNLWDWLELVLIPLILGIVAWYLGNIEKELERKRETEKHQQENIVKYLDLMTRLLLTENLKSSMDGSEVKSVARTQTIRLLREADYNRKGIVLQFLFESGLIFKDPIINLNGANIKNAELSGILLKNVSIKGAYFDNSNLVNSKLDNSDFSASQFNGANLSNSTFEGTDLTYANFIDAKICNCDFRNANLNGTNFSNANLKNSKITKEQSKLIIKTNVKNLKVE